MTQDISHKDIKQLFQTVNFVLEKIFSWFKAKKIFLNKGKTKNTLSENASNKDHIPLKLLQVYMNQKEIKRNDSIRNISLESVKVQDVEYSQNEFPSIFKFYVSCEK